ncbi:MAG: LpqB family beta-propeller domain-containing protein [Gordonia sp. (in: high G+C Gram-positive bacteria)]|uniref:LpqB family beta-propeller domain-containing protein n=1 Tax=Gordonia sp. (in: high G+C Gram-positive bacteria) TaxID=84139 RepID=UPI003BB7DACC
MWAVPRIRSALGPLALLITVLMVSTGCVAIPTSSPPQPVQGFNRSRPANLVPTPGRNDDPETLVRNLVKAMSDPNSSHRAARKFLTAGAAERWDDQGPMTLLTDLRVVIDERNESAVRLRVIGQRVGSLSAIGQLTPTAGEEVIPMTLSKSNEVWRVDGAIPAGTVTDTVQFDASYRLANLYFPDRTATRLVGDPRWLFGVSIDPTVVVNQVLAGPAPDLSGAVESAAGKDVVLRGPVVVDSGRISINLGGQIDVDTRKRTALAAQLIWSLNDAGISGTYLINAEGSPLIAERSDGWRTADVMAFDPDPDTGIAGLHVVRGGLYRVSGTGLSPVGGPLGAATDLVAAAIAVRQERVAAVAVRDGRQVLLQGPYGGAVSEVAAGATIGTPSFGAAADTGYAIIDGRPTVWTVDADGATRVVPLDTSRVTGISPGTITSFKVSPDGVRVALVVDGTLLLGALGTNDRGVPALIGVRVATYSLSTPVISIAWGDTGAVYAAREGEDTPVWRVPVSGLPGVALVSGNLKPPVRTVAATRGTVYAGDVRGVLELGTAPGSADQYWLPVGQVPEGAIPVTQTS